MHMSGSTLNVLGLGHHHKEHGSAQTVNSAANSLDSIACLMSVLHTMITCIKFYYKLHTSRNFYMSM